MTGYIPERSWESSVRFMLACLDGLAGTISHALAGFFRRLRCRVTILIDIPHAGIHVCGSRTLLSGYEARVRALVADWKPVGGARVNHDRAQNIVTVTWHGPRLHIWFVETPATLCSTGPLLYWIYEAAGLADREVASWTSAIEHARKEPTKPRTEFGVGPANYDTDRRVIREFAAEAIWEYVRDECLAMHKSLDAAQFLAIPDFLNSVLHISTTLEEGTLPKGSLCLYIGDEIDTLPFLARFESGQRPSLSRPKHVRKLLTAVADQDAALVTDGDSIFGIVDPLQREIPLLAQFKGRVGELLFGRSTLVTFASGRYFGSQIALDDQLLSDAIRRVPSCEALEDRTLEALSVIVRHAMQHQHGCTLVLDCKTSPSTLSGQRLADPFNLDSEQYLKTACAMSQVDGALHLTAGGSLLAFGCLLDGMRHTNEDLSRGARYNSALRFSASHSGTAVVVASTDGWLSVFEGGKDILEDHPAVLDASDGDVSDAFLPTPTLIQWLSGQSDGQST